MHSLLRVLNLQLVDAALCTGAHCVHLTCEDVPAFTPGRNRIANR